MKKNRFFAVALVAAALMFSSCDQMLETLYPEFKQGSGDTGKVVVELSYGSSIPGFGTGTYASGFSRGSYPIAVQFIPFMQQFDPMTNMYVYQQVQNSVETQTARISDFVWDQGAGKSLKRVSFQVKQNTTYKVIVWLDMDNNGRPTKPEDTGLPAEPGTIVSTSTGAFFLDLVYHKSTDPTIYMGTTLNSSDTINWEQLAADPAQQTTSGGGSPPHQPTIQSPFMTVQSGSEIALSSTNEYDPDGWIVDREWTIPSLGETYNGVPTLYKTFFNPTPGTTSTVTIKLRVKDNSGNWSPYDILTLNVQNAGTGTNAPPIAIISRDSMNQGNGSMFTINDGDYVFMNAYSSYDPDGNGVQSWEWTVTYPSMTPQIYYADNVYPVTTNPTTSDYDVSIALRVKDGRGTWSSSSTVTMRISGSAYNYPPFADFWVSPGLSVLDTDTIVLNDASTDGNGIADIMTREWYVDGSFVGNGTSLDIGTLSIGSHTLQLRVIDYGAAIVWSQPKTITVVGSGTDLPGSIGNPYILSLNSPVYGYVNYQEYVYFSVPLSSMEGPTIHLYGLASDVDLYVYPDDTLTSYVGTSTFGGYSDEYVYVPGATYTNVIVAVYGYNAGTYTLSAEYNP